MRTYITSVGSLFLGTTSVLACCMVPATYEGTIRQTAHEAVLVHAGGREELVLRINYAISGAEGMPENFAWVITVPHEPDAYRLADADLFRDMFRLAERLLVPKPRSFGRHGAAALGAGGGIELGRRVQVGPYDIQPVRAVGRAALAGLNAWLADHGYPTEDPDHMAYFVEQGFTFLCVRIAPGADRAAVDPGGQLPPLHLSFATEQPYYPLRFSSRQGVFDLNLHVLTGDRFDFDASEDILTRLSWSSPHFKQNVRLEVDEMPKTLREVLATGRLESSEGPWFYNNVRGRNLNRDNAIAKWEDDIFLRTAGG